MILTLVALLIIIVFKIKFFGKNFNTDFVAKNQTDALNGIFIFIVLLSHMRGYLPALPGVSPLASFCNTLGQMMVTSFLFVSGYGCTVSFQKKGMAYIKAMPKNRILTVFVNFDIAILIYWLMGTLMGKTYSAKTIIASLLAWDSIGNSSWYIFTILILYIGFYLCFRLFGEREDKFALFTSLVVFTVVFIKVIEYFKTTSNHWWYDTAFCFTVGVFFAYYKDAIFKAVTKSNVRYFSLLVLLIGAFIYLNQTGFYYTALYFNFYALIFISIMILILMKVRIGNKALSFLGSHVFEIYIFQRIPMILLSKYTPLTSDPKYYYFFFLAVVLGTFLITIVMHFIYGKVDGLIKNGIKKKA